MEDLERSRLLFKLKLAFLVGGDGVAVQEGVSALAIKELVETVMHAQVGVPADVRGFQPANDVLPERARDGQGSRFRTNLHQTPGTEPLNRDAQVPKQWRC